MKKYLPEIISDDLEEIDRSIPRALCQTYCGKQVIPGKIFCNECHRSWASERWRIRDPLAHQAKWVKGRRIENLQRHGIVLKEQSPVWSDWR